MKISKRLKTAEIVASDIVKLCKVAKDLEDAGEYTEAARALENLWQGVGVRPAVDDLGASKRAMVLSRVGSLTGWLGSMQQISESQEKAKDLIGEGANLFEAIHDHENWAEARSDLAVCYWREGNFDEARIILQDVLCSGLTFSPDLKAKMLLRLVTVETSTKHFEVALALLEQALSLINEKENPLLCGKFYFYRAFTFHCQGEERHNADLLTSAVNDYRKASMFYKESAHHRYVAVCENNIGNAYRMLRDFPKASLHLDKALKMYVKLKDKGRAARVYDNKARTFIDEGNLADAELASLTSVNMLKEGGEKAVLTESLTTLGVVLSRGGNVDYAVCVFEEAKEAALSVGDQEGAGNAVLTQIEELYKELTPIVFRNLYLEADELLKNSPTVSNLNRLQQIAKKQIEIDNPVSLLKNEKYFDWQNFSLPEAVHKYEKNLILKALNESEGRLTRAAKLLGVSHQSLSLILHQRHKDLQEYRVVRKPRVNYD